MKLVMVVVVALVASRADAAPVVVMVPGTWRSEPAPEAQLAPFKQIQNAQDIGGTVWRFDGGDLALVGFEVEAFGATRDFVEEMERGIDQGLGKSGKATVQPKTRRTENNRIVVDQRIEGSAHVHMRRIYVADSDDIVHVTFATCTSVAASAECDAALDTVRIPVQAVPLENDRGKAIAFRIGELIGFGLVMAVVGWLVFRVMRKKKGAALPNVRSV